MPSCSIVCHHAPCPQATDNLGTPSVVAEPPPGSAFPLGLTAVIVTAIDSAGMTDTCTFTVTLNGANCVCPPVGECQTCSSASNCVVSDLPDGTSCLGTRSCKNGVCQVNGAGLYVAP